ncbi:MAG TPA: LysR substrate-binding domain-containing protein [Stellaceae bacterium]|nr:LysR substrate-binding domain-containing protein [Stellaceae bacterium]
MSRPRLPPLNAIKAFEAAARLGSFTRAAEELGVTHGAVSRQVRLLEEWLGAPLFRRTSRSVVAMPAGAELLAEAGPVLDRLAEAALRLRSAAPAAGPIRVSALPTFAMRWLIPRLADFQRDHPRFDLRILTASTPDEQFRMEVEAVISGPVRQPGWIGRRFLGEARLPVLSPELMRRCPLRRPDDLVRHTLLHSATLPEAWPRWLAAAGVPQLKPLREQVFEHFYFAIQAAIEGLGVVMGPLALVADELREGRLVMPIPEPALRTRGYFAYVRAAHSDAPEVSALREWLVAAGGQAEAQLPSYLAARRSSSDEDKPVPGDADVRPPSGFSRPTQYITDRPAPPRGATGSE